MIAMNKSLSYGRRYQLTKDTYAEIIMLQKYADEYFLEHYHINMQKFREDKIDAIKHRLEGNQTT